MADPNATSAEETTPDLLKNTPNNIALLEGVIEQSEGRRKYHAQTRSPSDGNDVRWYFCKVPLADNELAASVPRSEIVGKGDYFRFGMRDSLAIEAAFLQREEELLSSWWKEYAECSEGPSGQATSRNDLDKQKDAFSTEEAEARWLYDAEEERVGVPVKGGLYEVDLVNRHCFPVYWSGENRRVLRGHWFARKGGLDWLPLREDVAEQLEMAYRKQVWHRRTFQPSGLFAARVNLQGSAPGLHALFTGEDDTWEAWLNVDASGFSGIVNFSGNGIKLRRGFSVSISAKLTQDELRQQKEEEMDDYCSQVPVGHLVFMVHGIGQRLEKSNLVDDVGNHRQITASLADRHLSSHQRGAQRVLFIPCQWRKGLKLSGEAAVDKITLDGVRGLRVTLSATVHDVLYYMSPIYCQDIIDSPFYDLVRRKQSSDSWKNHISEEGIPLMHISEFYPCYKPVLVSNQLNMLYLKFLKRNPGYHGKVSLYGHSLGSVLSYDILCHQETLSSPFPMDWMFREHARTNDSSMNRHGHSSRPESSDIIEGNHPQVVTQSKLDGNLREHYSMMSENLHMVPYNEPAENHSVTPSPVASDSCPTTELVTNSEQRTVQGDVTHGPIHEGSDMVCEEGLLDEATRTKLHNLSHGLEQTGKEDYLDVNTKDRNIAMLQEEINSLKAKINELESQCKNSDASSTSQQDETLHSQHKLEKTAGLNDSTKSYTPYIRYTKLEFKVDTFFAVGSPIGVFLALRNIRVGIGKGQDYWSEENISEEMPACRQMFNIFHPFDPVAYRVEPLVCKEFVSKRPVIIPYHRGGKRLHIGFQEFAEDLADRSQAILDHLNFVKIKVLTICQSRSADGLEDEPNNIEHDEERTYGSIMMERLTGSQDGRIDYMLQDKTFEHPYLQALGAHTNYWRDKDTALFILKHLYKDIPEEANTDEDPSVSSSKCESSLPPWSDQRDADEEDLPLTFSDTMVVKSFSRKAKKLLKKR